MGQILYVLNSFFKAQFFMPTTVLRYADTPRRHKSRLRPEFPHYSSHTRDSQDLGPRGGKDLNNNEIIKKRHGAGYKQYSN